MASNAKARQGVQAAEPPAQNGVAGRPALTGSKQQDKALARSSSGAKRADDSKPPSTSGSAVSVDIKRSAGGGAAAVRASAEADKPLSRSSSGGALPPAGAAGARGEPNKAQALRRSTSGKGDQPAATPKPSALHVASGKGPAQAGTKASSPRPNGGAPSASARPGREGAAAVGERAKGGPARPQGPARPGQPGDRVAAKAPTNAAARQGATASAPTSHQLGRHPSGAHSPGSAKSPSVGASGNEFKGVGPGDPLKKRPSSGGAGAKEAALAKGEEGLFSAMGREGASGDKSWMRDGTEFSGVGSRRRPSLGASAGDAPKGGSAEKGGGKERGGGAGGRSWLRDGSEFDGVSTPKKRPAPGAPGAPAAGAAGSIGSAGKEGEAPDAKKAKGRASTEVATTTSTSAPAAAGQQQPQLRGADGSRAGDKAKLQPPAPTTVSGVAVPEAIAVRCLELMGDYLPALHKVRCTCKKECAGAPGASKEVSMSEFEVHAGCRRKYWKESVSIAANGESLLRWLESLTDAGAELAFKNKGARPKAPSGAPASAAPASRAARAHDSEGGPAPHTPPDALAALGHGSLCDADAAALRAAFPHAPLFQRLRAPWPTGRCCVCNSDQEDDGGCKFFTCCSCGVWVHRECYGVPQAAGTDLWLCRRCTHQGEKGASAADPGPECCLCPVAGGALKPSTVPGLWVHLVCALWLPEPEIRGELQLEPVDGLQSIDLDRFRLLACGVCRQPQGACIQCDAPGCVAAYHPTCAMRAGFHMDLLPRDLGDGGVQLVKCTFCALHRAPYSSLANIWPAAEEAASRLKARGGSLKGGARITPPQDASQQHAPGGPQAHPAAHTNGNPIPAAM